MCSTNFAVQNKIAIWSHKINNCTFEKQIDIMQTQKIKQEEMS